MELEYRRNLNRSYMVIEGKKEETEDNTWDYEKEMLRQNEITALLTFYTTEVNGSLQFWYDITGKRSLRDFIEQDRITVENVSRILLCLSIACKEINRYLIQQNHICLTPDTIYMKQQPSAFSLCLCYFPLQNQDRNRQLQEMMEFLIENVDHEKEEETKLCYQLYEMATRPETTIEELLTLVQKQEEKTEEIYVEKVDVHRETAMPKTEEFLTEKTGTEEIRKKKTGWDMVSEWLQSVKQQLINKIKAWFEEKVHFFFPKKEAIEAFVMDQEQETVAETRMLSPQKGLCSGQLLYEGENGEKDYRIDREIFRIGTHATTNEAVLHSAVVSRHHAKIVRKNGEFFLEDLNSTNGTYVNGVLLNYRETVKLKTMDRISFADVCFRVI